MPTTIASLLLLASTAFAVIAVKFYFEATKLKKRSVDYLELHPFWKLAVLMTEARIANGFSTEELARRAGVSVGMIDWIEHTGRFPDSPVLLKITNALGKQIDIQLIDNQQTNL